MRRLNRLVATTMTTAFTVPLLLIATSTAASSATWHSGARKVAINTAKVSGTRTVTSTTTPTPAPAPAVLAAPPAVPNGQLYFGAFTPSGPYAPATMDAFTADAGRAPAIAMWYQAWGTNGTFDATAMTTAASRGAIPMLTWEPWVASSGVNQPDYSLANIAAGRYDDYVRNWALAARAWGQPLFLRFAHEMNAPYYPWSAAANGNTPAAYVQAWRHVHAIFAAVGASNVAWVWSPSIIGAGVTPLSELYPGDSYVDWVAVDGYNGGTALPWGGWLSFDQLFGSTLAQLSTLAPAKPQMIGEVASAEAGGSKAAWITDMFVGLTARPAVKAMVWFDQNKEADWRIESSIAAQSAFAAGVASSRVLAAR